MQYSTSFRARGVLIGMGIALASVGLPSPVSAQKGDQPRPSANPAPATDPVDTLQVSADTGRMLPAHVDWSRYTSPRMCVAASRNRQQRTDRLPNRRNVAGNEWLGDTLPYSIVRDTLSVETIQAIRACAAQFSATNVPPDELFGLLWLAILAKDDAMAEAVVERQISMDTVLTHRAEVLRGAIEMSLAGHPPRIDLAQKVMTRLDALGPEAHLAQLRARIVLMRYYRYAVSDFVQGLREADYAIALARLFTPEELEMGLTMSDALSPFSEKMYMLLVKDDPPRAVPQSIVDSLAVSLRHLLPDGEINYLVEGAETWATGFRFLGTPMPEITGDYVFKNNRVRSDSTPKVFLLVAIPPLWREKDLAANYQLYTEIRRLHAKYGAALSMKMYGKTVGWTRGSLALSPSEEAEAIRKYFQESQQLPADIIVAKSPITTLPDGRREVGRVAYEQVPARPVFLADADGKIQFAGGLYEANYVIDRVIDRLLAKRP